MPSQLNGEERNKLNNKYEVMDTLSRINRKLFTENGRKDDSFIGKGQIKVLKEIIENEYITQEELANSLKVDKTTVAKAVKKLESGGLIIRNRCKTDLRKKELVATEKALIIKKHMDKHLEEDSNYYFENISEDEIELFKSVLEKIEKNIENRRTIMNEYKQIAIKVLKLIEENQGITINEIVKLLDKDIDKVRQVIEKMCFKKLIEENDGKLSITDKVTLFRAEHHL